MRDWFIYLMDKFQMEENIHRTSYYTAFVIFGCVVLPILLSAAIVNELIDLVFEKRKNKIEEIIDAL
jgi:hypothetical protein